MLLLLLRTRAATARPPVPAWRRLEVPAERRVLSVEMETRLLRAEPEGRVLSVAAEDRTLAVPRT
jgi:hypothetical protein